MKKQSRFNLIANKYTKAMTKAIGKPMFPREARGKCRHCGTYLPKYPGRYAKDEKCPFCGKIHCLHEPCEHKKVD